MPKRIGEKRIADRISQRVSTELKVQFLQAVKAMGHTPADALRVAVSQYIQTAKNAGTDL